MNPAAPMEVVYEERIARFLELAEAAQEAAGRTRTSGVRQTYLELAKQWAHLAELAQSTLEIARKMSLHLERIESTRQHIELH